MELETPKQEAQRLADLAYRRAREEHDVHAAVDLFLRLCASALIASQQRSKETS